MVGVYYTDKRQAFTKEERTYKGQQFYKRLAHVEAFNLPPNDTFEALNQTQ